MKNIFIFILMSFNMWQLKIWTTFVSSYFYLQRIFYKFEYTYFVENLILYKSDIIKILSQNYYGKKNPK